MRKILLLVAVVGDLASAWGGIPTYAFLDSFGTMGNGDGQFQNPGAVVYDPATDQIFVADTANNRVQRFSAAGVFQIKWGSMGSGNGQFNLPFGITLNPLNGNLFVTDFTNGRFQEFTTAGGFVAKTGTVGSGPGEFGGPLQIAVGNGQIYVTEQTNSRVQRFDLVSRIYLGQWGSGGFANGQFINPGGIAVDSSGDVYVVEFGNNRVQRFDPAGLFEINFGTTGVAPGQFISPFGTTTDSRDRVYVCDRGNNRVQVLAPTGEFITSFGESGSGPGQMITPNDIALGPGGILYVVDNGNDRIQRWRITEHNARPKVRIKGGKSIQTSAAKTTVRGTVKDADGSSDIVEVTAKVGRRTVKVTGTKRWKLRAPLTPGLNKVVVTATDSFGATSKKAILRITRDS